MKDNAGHGQFTADHPPRHSGLRGAVTRELGSVRKLVKKGLEDNDYHAVEQDNFPPDLRELKEELERVLGPARTTKEVLDALDRDYRSQGKPAVWFLPLKEPIAPHRDQLLRPAKPVK